MKKTFLILTATIISSAIFSMDEAPKKKHIVYHPYYDITFFGFERVHPFDSCKYSRIAQTLVAKKVLEEKDFHQPKEITDADLELVHDKRYLDTIHHCASAVFTKASEVPVFFLPNFLVRWKALYPMRLATGGTVEATTLALQNQWAINLSGGYHHAKSNTCGGFCIYSDTALAARKAITENNIKKILLIDLDAHQGNGNEEILGSQEIFKDKVIVFDMYGAQTYPGYIERKLLSEQKTWYDIPVDVRTTDDVAYHTILTNKLPSAIEETNPELIIYNAGTDILQGDPVGHMHITKDGIIKRDAFVFEEAKKRGIPIVMMLSGGYTQESAGVIADSIENIFKIMEKNENIKTTPINIKTPIYDEYGNFYY